MISKAGSFLHLTLVNFNEALNEIPVLSRASMFTSHQLWAGTGTWNPGTESSPAGLPAVQVSQPRKTAPPLSRTHAPRHSGWEP